mmetsp:Transcript_37671/g.99642  ORF Transcript_37671/g.99642 Transcript_37671/m.99642 type:complete len:234 (+) Transcript_37671:1409-2110(+)
MHVPEVAAGEPAGARQEARPVEGVDEEGDGLGAGAHHDADVPRRQDGRQELQPAPAALPPRSIVAGQIGVHVRNDRRHHEEQGAALDVRGQGDDGVGRVLDAGHVAARRHLRHGAVVDPHVHVGQGRPPMLRAEGESPELPRVNPVVLDPLDLSVHQAGQDPLEAPEVVALRVRLRVAQPLVRDADDLPVHLLGPRGQVAAAASSSAFAALRFGAFGAIAGWPRREGEEGRQQ